MEQCIEFLAVVMFSQMAKLVQQNIVDAVAWRTNEGRIKID